MTSKTLILIAVGIIILILGWLLIMTPAPQSGKAFTSENVNVSLPLVGGTVLPEFKVTGEAKGTWYFEASFPVEVQDKNGTRVGGGIAQAQGDWMTEEFVPFEASVTIEGGYSGPAKLILHKDNPSGLPENEDSVSYSIVVQ